MAPANFHDSEYGSFGGGEGGGWKGYNITGSKGNQN